MYKVLEGHKIVPVIQINHIEDTLPLADALYEGGINIMEITFRTKEGQKAIEIVAKERPHILVGAGTVTTVEQVEAAVAAGAKFVVSPGFDADVVKSCLDHNVIPLPGCVTPSEIMQGLKFNLEVFKFFPASVYGGINAIKNLSGPFGKIKFLPTGGVSADNLKDYLSLPQVFACGGSWMVKSNLIEEKRFDEITKLAKEAVEISKSI